MAAVAKVKIHYRDESLEPTSTQFYINDAVSALTEWAGMFLGGSPFQLMKTALAGVTDMQFVSGSTTFVVDSAVGAAATVKGAQREAVLRIKIQDIDNSRISFINVGGFKESLRTAHSDVADFADGAGLQALKDAIEANCLSRDGNAIQVISGRFTGKNA